MPDNNKKIYQMQRKTMPHMGGKGGNGIMQRQKLHFFFLLLRLLRIGDIFQKAKDPSNMGESPVSPGRYWEPEWPSRDASSIPNN